MTGHIPESFIEELISRADIVEIISTRIPLKRQGANYSAKCPFHTEKSPSFTVSPSKQFYHCFGCGAHGSVIRFLMEFEGIHFVEACESLASRLGMVIPMDNDNNMIQSSSHHQIYTLLEEANKFFQLQLRQPIGKRAIEYLKARGLTGQTAKTFELGFAPPGWDNLVSALKGDEARFKDLIEAGLVIRKDEDRYFDRFRDRVMFPIRDRRGRVIGFGGRILDKGTPKYLNSPETPVFSKGQEVYGFYEARLKNRHLTSLIVVEGYIDVLCLSQFGIENVVATLGTALSEKHLELLFRHVSELYFCFDGDTAGRAAAKKALNSCLPYMKEGRRIKFIFLPNSEDPDSFVRRQGKAAFLDLLQHATSLSDYLFDSLSATLDLNHIDGRAELVTRSRPLIARLPKGVLQQMMFERLSELTKLPQQMHQKRGNFKNQFSNQHRSSSIDPLPSPALRALAMLLDDKNLLSLISIPHGFEEVDIPGTTLLCAIIDIFRKDPGISVDSLEKHLAEECATYFKSIDLKSILRFIPEHGKEAEFAGALARLEERAAEQALELLLLKSKSKALSPEEKVQLRYLIDQKEKIRVD